MKVYKTYSQIKRVVKGVDGNKSFWMFFQNENDEFISPWHNISLKDSQGNFQAIFEIPHNWLAKMELATDEEFNPIKQDMKKSWISGEKELWYYAKFPYFNYGFIP